MKKKIKVLVVDDEAVVRESLQAWLGDAGYLVFAAENGPRGLEIIEKENPNVAIVDLVMPGMGGIELLKKAGELCPGIQVIIVTAYGSVPTAISAMKEGAYDYIEKPFSPEKVELLVERSVKHQELVEENISLHRKLEKRYSFEDIIAKSPGMQRVIELVKTVAESSASVLITGQSGTGKEVVARAIHSQSPRRDKPFVPVSCAALPESLLESELFGHTKGAFTGAHAQRKGKFEFADKGTLFLDEIGDMSVNIQVHLLRVLEEKAFTRVGGNELIKVDVRVISATNKDLKKAIAQDRFRGDLYYRLNVVTIDLPPLTERKEDIILLAEHFLKGFAAENKKEIDGFSPEVAEFLFKYRWPGNVRELENTVERAVILAKGPSIKMSDLLQKDSPLIDSPGAATSLKDVEKNHILSVLEKTGWNYSKTARILGITRPTLYKKARAYGLGVKETGGPE